MLTYLESLTLRLATQVAELPIEMRKRHSQYLLAAQREDGGFGGREGGSDLYYTGFALRALGILGQLDGAPADRAAQFLRDRLTREESIIDFFSLIYGVKLLESAAGIDVFKDSRTDWADTVWEALGALHGEDGGYAKGEAGKASSTYHSFLVTVCLELIDRPIHDPDGLIRFLHAQRCEDGGFREIRVSKRAGTNPTAAAIATLRILDALDDESREGTIDFLCEMQSDEGGLRANTRIPIADGLSTFTGVLTLQDLDANNEIDTAAARRFAQSLESEEGGFYGASWDQARDVEYTFYGLGACALMQPTAGD